ncbi:MAG: CpaD family pilus assembly lipoprotein, partial [Notoacmeibacter sp.]
MRKTNTAKNCLPLIAVMVVASTTLSGCAMFGHRDHIEVGAIPDDYRTRHPIVIAETQKQLMVPVGNAARDLSFAEKEVVSGFLSNFKSQGSGAIYINTPSGSANSGAAGHVANEVAQVALANGLHGRVMMEHYSAPADQPTPPVIVS